MSVPSINRPPDYDGGVCPDADLREMYMCPEWYAAAWRDEAFGLPRSTQHPMVLAAIDRTLGDYVTGGRLKPELPVGSDRLWKRGTWASVSWARGRDRWTELWVETHPLGMGA